MSIRNDDASNLAWLKRARDGWTTWQNLGGNRCFRHNRESAITLDTIRALLAAQGLHIVDQASAKVLEACAAMSTGDDERDEDDEPGEPLELGEDCYIYTDDQYAIAKAELARRGRKEET